ncbi:two-component system response regulator [Burkholderia mayonis]|uniref:Two-component system response regulator n=1 Tax=Burkholderia mayonis TaxID=1385591 RepID=A0A1B4FG07_9BURK|nr:response regulator [Burkholderia mayonis]AOJ02620.1 two-component system response regulator [Burkholderia mayonis]KVE41735.1 two-component system response regulator [Burkholderia mayonis]
MIEPAVTVVLIDDETCIRHFVSTALAREGLAVFDAGTDARGLDEIARRHPDLLIVDINLPDIDGVDLIREIRRSSSVPLIVLSSRDRESDKVAALNAGADDYLTKPFGLPELVARIQARLRRLASNPRHWEGIVRFGCVTIDLGERRVMREGGTVHLSRTEYRLIALLAQHAGRLLTYDQLLTEIWGPSHTQGQHYLRVYVGHLRQKLERDPGQPEHILTEAGEGYRLVGVQ